MTWVVLPKLLAILATVALGWTAVRAGWIASRDGVAGRVLTELAFYLLIPALLFRTMVRLDMAALPWNTLAAYFVPAVPFMLAVYLWHRRRASMPSAPATLALAASYGNAVQLGIPMASALFGETGLALHLAIVALHGLVLLTLSTVLVEADLARAHRAASPLTTLAVTAKNAVLHPVTLPVLAGLAWNATGLGLTPVLDEALAVLGQGVVPVCLVLLGVNLAQYGLQGRWRGSLAITLTKLVALPTLVLVVAHWGFGLAGVPLAVVVMLAALPVGTNALIMAERYGALQAEATAAIVVSSVAFVATSALWLALLALLAQSGA